MNSFFSYMSNLNVTTLNEHIYRGEGPKGRLKPAKGVLMDSQWEQRAKK